jgi:hypothetical protein
MDTLLNEAESELFAAWLQEFFFGGGYARRMGDAHAICCC